MSDEIECPTCPRCGGPPHASLAMITLPWFCPNDSCEVFGWDPTTTKAHNLANTVVHDPRNQT